MLLSVAEGVVHDAEDAIRAGAIEAVAFTAS
jgi:hypothetical protein